MSRRRRDRAGQEEHDEVPCGQPRHRLHEGADGRGCREREDPGDRDVARDPQRTAAALAPAPITQP